MRYFDLFEKKDELELPPIDVGDEVMVGKFKNRKAVVKGFTKDEHNQPVLKTDKGDQKLFKPRISKLEQMTEAEAAWKSRSQIENFIKELYKTYGVWATIRAIDDEPAFEILIIQSNERGNGNASIFMKKLCAKADELVLSIKLEPEQVKPYEKHVGDKPTPTTEQLIAWYKRLGFVKTGDSNHGRDVMVRMPTSPQ